MNVPVFVFFRMRQTEAWYQLSKAEQDTLSANVENTMIRFGGKMTLLCHSSWSDERWEAFGVVEFPDVESVRQHNIALHELNWFRYIDSETMLGTPFPEQSLGGTDA